MIYHCSISVISRSSGRSICAAAAYRAGDKIKDYRSGIIHDYKNKRGIITTGLYGVPSNLSRSELWNLAEISELRKNSVTGREIRIALPQNIKAAVIMAEEFAMKVAARYNVGVDMAIHESSEIGDSRNVHGHFLLTARPIDPITGDFAKKKDRVWNVQKPGEVGGKETVKSIRELWQTVYNSHRQEYGLPEIDHRSHKDRGIEEVPSRHLGLVRTAMKRRDEENPEAEPSHTPEAQPRQRTNPDIEKLEAEAAKLQKELDERVKLQESLLELDMTTTIKTDEKVQDENS